MINRCRLVRHPAGQGEPDCSARTLNSLAGRRDRRLLSGLREAASARRSRCRSGEEQ